MERENESNPRFEICIFHNPFFDKERRNVVLGLINNHSEDGMSVFEEFLAIAKKDLESRGHEIIDCDSCEENRIHAAEIDDKKYLCCNACCSLRGTIKVRDLICFIEQRGLADC